MELIDFTDPAQAQNYVLALRSFIIELKGLRQDQVSAILLKYNIHDVYAPKDTIHFRLNIDWPQDQAIITG